MRRASTVVAAALACALGALAQAPQTAAGAPVRSASVGLARQAGKALFVESKLVQARHYAAAALDKDAANIEALFVTMEAAALQADTAAELEAAVRLCQLGARDPRVHIAAARLLDLAANTSAFRAVAPRLRRLAARDNAQSDFLRIALLAAAQDGFPGPPVLELAHQAGFLTDWRLVGPFGELGQVDFERTWPPEQDAITAPTAAGKVLRFADGNVVAKERYSRGVYYAFAEATLPTPGEWLVRAESAGTLTVLVDGKPALIHDDRFRFLPAIASARIRLSSGRHAVLVKFLASASPFRIALAHPHYTTASATYAGTRQEDAFVKAARQYWAGDYAAAIATLGRYSQSPAALGFLQAQAWAHLTGGSPEEVAALKSTLAAAPDAYAAETMLVARYYSDERFDEALPRSLRVTKARPDFAPAQQLKYQLASRMHWQAEASDAVNTLARLHPSCSVLRDASNFFRLASEYKRAREIEDALESCGSESAHRAAANGPIADSDHPRAIDPAEAFYTPFRRNGPDLVRSTASRLFSGGPAVTLLDARVLRLRQNGGADLYVHKLTRVLDRDGIQQFGEVTIPSGADLLELRTLTPAGIVSGEPELDKRKATISMPALSPGNVIEQEYVTHFPAGDVAKSFSYPFGSLEAPILFARFVVISPAGMRMSISASPGAPNATGSRNGAEEIRVWERNDIAQSVQEANMPAAGQLPEVSVSRSSFGDWREVRRYYRNAIIESGQAGERAAELAAAVPGSTDEQKARTAYIAITSKIRANGHSLEQGFASAEDTLSAGGGSRTSAFLATTRVLGIPAELVLAREIGAPVPRQPSLDVYTHPLVRLRLIVPGGAARHVTVDVETDELPFGSRPPTLDGSRALLVPIDHVPARDPLFISLPAAPDSEQSVAEGDVALDTEGNLSARLRITLGTWRGSQIRSILRGIPPGGRQRFFEQLATRIFPGAVGVTGEAINEDDAEHPLELKLRCRAPHFVSFAGASADIDQLAPALGLRRMFARGTERRFPLYIDSPFFETTRMRVRLPDNVRVAQLAPEFNSDQRFGSYSVRFQKNSPREYEVTRSFHLPVQVIAPADYPEFARFANRIDDAERQRLTVARIDLSARKR